MKTENCPTREWNPKKLELFYDYGAMGYLYRFKKLVEEVRTPYQTIHVLKHDRLGMTTLIDGDIMGSEFDDEYDYGMIQLLETHPIEKALILGGGDGSLATKISRYTKEVTVVEIDRAVRDVHQKYFEETCTPPPNVKFVFENAFTFMNENDTKYDVVFDDMFTIPMGFKQAGHYFHKLAERFKGTQIISQTDSKNAGVAGQIIKTLQPIAKDIHQIEQFVPTYLENWTFTSWRPK